MELKKENNLTQEDLEYIIFKFLNLEETVLASKVEEGFQNLKLIERLKESIDRLKEVNN